MTQQILSKLAEIEERADAARSVCKMAESSGYKDTVLANYPMTVEYVKDVSSLTAALRLAINEISKQRGTAIIWTDQHGMQKIAESGKSNSANATLNNIAEILSKEE